MQMDLECDHPEDRQLKLGQYQKFKGVDQTEGHPLKTQIVSVMACDVCSYQYELRAKEWW